MAEQYDHIGAVEIYRHLGFSSDQVHFIGQLRSLENDEELVRFVRLEDLTNLFSSYPKGYIFEKGKERKISLTIPLQPRWRNVSHEDLKVRIRRSLDEVGISKGVEIFGYCTRSYGIEHEGVSAVIGCLHFRTDKLLDPKDKLNLEMVTV